MRKRTLSLALALVMALSLAVPAFAFTTPDFTDLPSDNWAYEPVMRMADAGVIKGTGGGAFSPEMKVSVAQFLTLVGRVVFSDVKAEGADWFGPYIQEAQAQGLLDGTQVNVNAPEAEISRYDMAVILRGAAKQLGVAEKAAQPSQVTDYGLVPTMYADAVLAVYGMGLIQGDQNGNFNGANTMMRNETATVMDRLIALKGDTKPGPGGTTTAPDTPTETDPPAEPEMITYQVNGRVKQVIHNLTAPEEVVHYGGVPYKVYYTKDGGKTSTLVAEGISADVDPENPIETSLDKGAIRLQLTFPSDAFYEEGSGIYISVETVVGGQRLVTKDLRTDNHAGITPTRLSYNEGFANEVNALLTPPNGEKAHFTFSGYVAYTAPGDWADSYPEGFKVQLLYKDGTTLGEAITKPNGTFSVECTMDALDGGFSTRKKLYYVAVEGVLPDGTRYHSTGLASDGQPILRSLVDLDVVPMSDGITATHNCKLYLPEKSIVKN